MKILNFNLEKRKYFNKIPTKSSQHNVGRKNAIEGE